MKMIKITTKDSDSPSITKEIEKPSKRKQTLHSKLQTATTKKLEKNIKITKSIFNLI